MKWLALFGLLLVQEPDIDGLLKQLTDESIEVREKAAAALIELGDKAEEKVKARMASAEGELQKRCQWILERIAIPKKLRGVLPPLKKVTVEAKEAKLKEVLEDLQRQTGMAMNLEGVGEASVTLTVKDVAPLEALDAVCKAARLGYFISDHYQKGKPGGFLGAGPGLPGGAGESSGAGIRFQPGGYVDVGRQFVRHYLIEPTNIMLMKSDNFRQSNSSAQLNLRVLWPPEVNPRVGTITVASATDDKGRGLYEPPKNVDKYQSGGGSTSRGGLSHTISMAYPESDARKIASVKGMVSLKFVMEEKILTFDAPEKPGPKQKELDGLTADLTEFKAEGGVVTLTVVLSGRVASADPAGPPGMHFHSVPIRIKTEDGNTGFSGGSSRSGGGGTTTCQMTYHRVSSKVIAVEVVVDTIYHEDMFDFELKDIPLPK